MSGLKSSRKGLIRDGIRGNFFSDKNRITSKIQAEGLLRKWIELHPEAVCLIREKFSDDDLKAMGSYYIVGIHKPIQFGGDPRFLRAYRYDDGSWLGERSALPDRKWHSENGFAFSVPQVSPQVLDAGR